MSFLFKQIEQFSPFLFAIHGGSGVPIHGASEVSWDAAYVEDLDRSVNYGKCLVILQSTGGDCITNIRHCLSTGLLTGKQDPEGYQLERTKWKNSHQNFLTLFRVATLIKTKFPEKSRQNSLYFPCVSNFPRVVFFWPQNIIFILPSPTERYTTDNTS